MNEMEGMSREDIINQEIDTLIEFVKQKQVALVAHQQELVDIYDDEIKNNCKSILENGLMKDVKHGLDVRKLKLQAKMQDKGNKKPFENIDAVNNYLLAFPALPEKSFH